MDGGLYLIALHQLFLLTRCFGALFVALHIVAGVKQLSGDLAAMEVPVTQRFCKCYPINFRAECKLVRGTFGMRRMTYMNVLELSNGEASR